MKILNKMLYKIYICFILYIFSYSIFAGSQSNQGIGQVLVNLSQIYPQVYSFLNGFTIVVGVAFIIMAMFKLKHLADFRNMMQGQQEVGKALALLIIGVAFLWMPFMLNAFTYTFYGMTIGQMNDGIYSSVGSGSQYSKAFFQLMQVIGIISFIRGWFLLSTISKGGTQPGTIGKAITHIVSGLFLFHARATMKIIENSLGVPIMT